MQARDSQRTRQPPPRGRTAAINIALAVIAMLGIALGLRLANRGELISHRVVIGVQGCNAECTARLARSLSDRLSTLGFDAAAPQGERIHAFEGPESVREFARTHGARFAVMLRVAVEGSTPLVGAAGTRVGANATLYVMDASAQGAPRPSYTLRAVDEADDESTAIALLGARFAQALFPIAGAELLGSEAIKGMLDHASGLEQQAAALAFKRRQRELREREDAIREYRLDCEANDAALGSVEDGHCVSDGCAEEYLVGLLPDGRSAVVHDSTDLALFPLEPHSTARSLVTSERLWLVPRSGPRTLLAESANFESRPDLSRDGSTLAFIEQRGGRARLYTLALHGGERRLIASAELPDHLSAPQLSADGSQLLYSLQKPQRGSLALMRASTRGAAAPERVLPEVIDARWAELTLAGQTAPNAFVAALVPPDGPDQTDADDDNEPHIEVLDLSTGKLVAAEDDAPRPALVLIDPVTRAIVASETAPAHRIRAIGGVYADSLLLSWEDTSCGFARFRPGSPIEWVTTEVCPKHITVGKTDVLAHALVGQSHAVRQLVRIDVEHGRLELLTKGTLDVQSPIPAAAAAGYAYERVLPRKYGELQHVAVCFDAR